MLGFHRPLEFEVSTHSEIVESKIEKMVDYDLVIDYHLGKTNMVADALSRKSSITLAYIHTVYVPLLLI